MSDKFFIPTCTLESEVVECPKRVIFSAHIQDLPSSELHIIKLCTLLESKKCSARSLIESFSNFITDYVKRVPKDKNLSELIS